jgi:hypothetical protein
MMTMAGSGCLIDHAETLIAITRSICELTEAAFSASPPLVVNQAARVVNPMPTCSSSRQRRVWYRYSACIRPINRQHVDELSRRAPALLVHGRGN